MRRLLLVLWLCLTGCSGGAGLMAEIANHAEDATIRAQALIKDNPKLVHYRDGQGRTPLHIAADYCNPTISALLLEKGADPNAVDKQGNTAMHYAVDPFLVRDYSSKPNASFIIMNRLYEDQRRVMRQLEAKTDKTLKNKAGKTWEEVAQGAWEPEPSEESE